ncbi:MAG: hypothetical protein JWM34_1193 [Ilumatobacteraceae bacterium]|nr:hypothetical protein [Ilumatobacteraceae bacterium]
MSRSWPYLAAVAAVGVLAGVAIGGKPESRDGFVLAPDQIPTTTIATDDTAGSSGPVVAVTTTTVDLGVPSTAASTGSSTSDTTPGSPADTTAPAEVTTTTVAGGGSRIVLVDGSGTSDALTTARDELAGAGYAQVVPTTPKGTVATTTVYYRAGFATQAAQVASILGFDRAPLVLLTTQVISAADQQGDVVIALGPDAVG